MPASDSPRVTPILQERWYSAFTEGFGYDIIDAEGGVTAEKIPIERDAKLMALTPQLVEMICRLAPFSDVAQKVRAAVGEDEWNMLIGRT